MTQARSSAFVVGVVAENDAEPAPAQEPRQTRFLVIEFQKVDGVEHGRRCRAAMRSRATTVLRRSQGRRGFAATRPADEPHFLTRVPIARGYRGESKASHQRDGGRPWGGIAVPPW